MKARLICSVKIAPAYVGYRAMLVMHHCGITGLVVLLITMGLALFTLFMLVLYDDSNED